MVSRHAAQSSSYGGASCPVSQRQCRTRPRAAAPRPCPPGPRTRPLSTCLSTTRQSVGVQPLDVAGEARCAPRTHGAGGVDQRADAGHGQPQPGLEGLGPGADEGAHHVVEYADRARSAGRRARVRSISTGTAKIATRPSLAQKPAQPLEQRRLVLAAAGEHPAAERRQHGLGDRRRRLAVHVGQREHLVPVAGDVGDLGLLEAGVEGPRRPRGAGLGGPVARASERVDRLVEVAAVLVAAAQEVERAQLGVDRAGFAGPPGGVLERGGQLLHRDLAVEPDQRGRRVAGHPRQVVGLGQGQRLHGRLLGLLAAVHPQHPRVDREQPGPVGVGSSGVRARAASRWDRQSRSLS